MPRPMILMDPRIGTKPEMLELISSRKHRAALVHMLAIIYVTQHGTDGFLPRGVLKLVHGRRSDAAALVEVGLWHETEDGWGIYDWVENQLHRPRVPIPRSVRAEIFQRDVFACVQCGSVESLSIDHIIAWANGGTNSISNLQTLCQPCNSRKADN